MSKTHHVAVIGRTGKGNYGHGLDTVWLAFDNVEVVAVADEDEAGRTSTAKKLKAKNVYADYRQMLAQEKPELVAVAPRWLDCHRDMVVACAEAGAHVFMEKPLCQTLAQADDMVAACERHHVKLAIAHQTRYSPRLQRIKELIAEGKLGDVLELRGRGKDEARGGGEDLMVLGSHIMDLMRLIAGDPRWCQARVLEKGKPITKADVRAGNEGIGPLAGDNISASYGFDKGVIGHFATQRVQPGGRFGLQILGTKGMIHVVTGSLPAAFFCPDPTWGLSKARPAWQEISSAGLGQPETLTGDTLGLGNIWIVQDLLDSIAKDRQALGSVYDGRAALEMILATYESARLQAPVDLPLKNRAHPLTLLN
jgi:predicted dehydrogenase